MKFDGKKFIVVALFTLSVPGNSQNISTADIDRFWVAYDLLKNANTTMDSIHILQTEYLDKASRGFKKFIKARNFTAREYVTVIERHPKFWKSIRPLTLTIAHRKSDIEEVMRMFSMTLPNSKMPDVCFAIGSMRTGGTTTKNLVLVGAEIAAADNSVINTELSPWLKSVLGKTGDITAMVAHETVHTQQQGFPFNEIFRLLKYKKLNLLNMAIVEGSADFITSKFGGSNINSELHQYGKTHHCNLWNDFKRSFDAKPFEYSKWLYNGSQHKDERPADLGYYIGYVISEGYFNNAADKQKALKTLLKRGRYKEVYRKSVHAVFNCPQ